MGVGYSNVAHLHEPCGLTHSRNKKKFRTKKRTFILLCLAQIEAMASQSLLVEGGKSFSVKPQLPLQLHAQAGCNYTHRLRVRAAARGASCTHKLRRSVAARGAWLYRQV
jgi:hypothetical protein